MALRRDTVSKEAVHIAIGITPEETKWILGYSIAPIESSENWQELFENSISRGLEKVSLFCIDGFAGMETVIEECFPMAKIQRCFVHVSRNISKKIRVSDRKEILQDFKEVYKSKTK